MEFNEDILVYKYLKVEWAKLSDYKGVLPPQAVLVNKKIYETNEAYRDTTDKRLAEKIEKTRLNQGRKK